MLWGLDSKYSDCDSDRWETKNVINRKNQPRSMFIIMIIFRLFVRIFIWWNSIYFSRWLHTIRQWLTAGLNRSQLCCTSYSRWIPSLSLGWSDPPAMFVVTVLIWPSSCLLRAPEGRTGSGNISISEYGPSTWSPWTFVAELFLLPERWTSIRLIRDEKEDLSDAMREWWWLKVLDALGMQEQITPMQISASLRS